MLPLEAALEKYRPPRAIRSGRDRLTVFRDEDDFTGSEYHESLQENLLASAKLVVVCSPAARDSSYVNDEIQRFAAGRRARDIIPVLLSGIPNNEATGDEDDDRAFPDALLSALPLPLAVDFRGFDSRTHKLSRRPYQGAWFTLLANVCNSSREEIEQRERRRGRVARVRIATIAAAVVVSAAFGLAMARSATLEQSRALAQLANDAVARGSLDQALRFAVLATHGNWLLGPAPEAEVALRRAAHASHHIATSEGQSTLSRDGESTAAVLKDAVVRVSATDSGTVLATFTDTEQPKNVVFSPDGRYVATELPHAAHVWEIATGKMVTELAMPDAILGSVAFDVSGQRIITRTNAAAQLWAMPSGTLLATMPDADFGGGAISPDGRTVFTIDKNGMVRLWDADGVLQREIPASTNNFLHGVFSQDSRSLLTFSMYDKIARIWNVNDGSETRQLSFHDEPLSFATFSPDASLVVAAAIDKSQARVWQLTDGKAIADLVGPAQFSSVTFSPDGAHVLAGFADGRARLWDARTGLELTTFSGNVRGWVTAIFTPGGDRVLTSAPGTTRLWTARGGDIPILLGGHTSGVRSASFSQDGKRIVTSSWDQTARTWDVESGRELKRFIGHTSTIAVAAFDSTGQRVVTASHDGTARVWNAGTGEQLAALVGHEVLYEGEMRVASFSPDGSRIVTASDDQTARLWTPDGKAIATLKHTNAVWRAAFSPDGRLLATASDDNTARLWRSVDGTLVATLMGHEFFVRTAAFSPDGALLVTGSDDKTARIWEVPSGQLVRSLTLQTGRITQVQFSPDGSRIVTASDDGTARVWSARGEPLARIDPHGGGIVSVAFSPDGRLLVTGSFDKVAHVWDVVTGAELARFGGQDTYVDTVAFSPDGTRLLTSAGNTPRLYDLHWLTRKGGAELVAAVCREKLRGIGRITEEDGIVLRGLSARTGEDVCGV